MPVPGRARFACPGGQTHHETCSYQLIFFLSRCFCFFFLRDRHGSLRRRVFSRRRGLSPAELQCLETFDYSAAGLAAFEGTPGEDYSGLTEAGGGEGEPREESRSVRTGAAGSELAGDETDSGGGAEVAGSRSDGEEASGSGLGSGSACSDCAICLGGFEDADMLRKLPW